jgi:CBS domain containing-hemolysin-like protein
VGGLLGKLLGKVPIPGASVQLEGLRLVAESAEGRRRRIGTVLVREEPAESDDGEDPTAGRGRRAPGGTT